jgi:hypothetical protein
VTADASAPNAVPGTARRAKTAMKSDLMGGEGPCLRKQTRPSPSRLGSLPR